MDITRKNDSSGTKTHPTTTTSANKQPVCDQTQQPGETLPKAGAVGGGGTASHKTADTCSATTEKMSDLRLEQSKQTEHHATAAPSLVSTSSSTDGNGSGISGTQATFAGTTIAPANMSANMPANMPANAVVQSLAGQPTAQTTAVSALFPQSSTGSACTAVALMSNVASLVNPPIQQPSLIPPAGGATSSSQMPATSSSTKTVQRPAVFDKVRTFEKYNP